MYHRMDRMAGLVMPACGHKKRGTPFPMCLKLSL